MKFALIFANFLKNIRQILKYHKFEKKFMKLLT